MANTSDGDKGDPPYSPNADTTPDDNSALFTAVNRANDDSILTDIDRDMPYDRTLDIDFEVYDTADDVADADMLDPPAPGTNNPSVTHNNDTSLGANTAIRTTNAHNNTSTSITANTDAHDEEDNGDDADDDHHMTDIDTSNLNLTNATSTITDIQLNHNNTATSTNSSIVIANTDNLESEQFETTLFTTDFNLCFVRRLKLFFST